MNELLTREMFNETCIKRDNNQCRLCGVTEKLSVHHIIERKLWSDGGYYKNNGITVCPECHLLTEAGFILPSKLWFKMGINKLYPEGLNYDNEYDKWGNEVLMRGEYGEFIIIPTCSLDKLEKAVKLANGIIRMVTPEYLKEHYRLVCNKTSWHIVRLFKFYS